jgi:hypothetical protein
MINIIAYLLDFSISPLKSGVNNRPAPSVAVLGPAKAIFLRRLDPSACSLIWQ